MRMIRVQIANGLALVMESRYDGIWKGDILTENTVIDLSKAGICVLGMDNYSEES